MTRGDDTALALIGTECKAACAGEKDFETRVKKAMKPVKDGHWMFPDDDISFRGAIAGVLMAEETTQEEKDRIAHTLNGLRSLAALISGVPVDMDAMVEEQSKMEPVPLVKWWHEVKAA